MYFLDEHRESQDVPFSEHEYLSDVLQTTYDQGIQRKELFDAQVSFVILTLAFNMVFNKPYLLANFRHLTDEVLDFWRKAILYILLNFSVVT